MLCAMSPIPVVGQTINRSVTRSTRVLERARQIGRRLFLASSGIALGLTLGVLTHPLASPAQSGAASPAHLWTPVEDEVYLQEIGQKISTEKPATSIAVHDNTVFVVVGGTMKTLRDGALQEIAGAPADVKRMRSLAGALWTTGGQGTHRFAASQWVRVDEQSFNDFCLHLGRIHAATRSDVYRFEDGRFVNLRPTNGYLQTDTTMIMEDGTQILSHPVDIGPVDRIASYSGTLYLLRRGRLALFEGRTFVEDPVDWGMMPSRITRDLLALGSRLYVATDRGVAVLRGMALTVLRGAEGLPYEDTTCLARGFGDDLWIGTSRGAIRQTGGEFHYFGVQRWLPGEFVRDIAVNDHTVYIATDGGLGIIQYEPYTLAKKAAYFERELKEGGYQRLGFVHKLYWSGEPSGWLREISDNDGGNSAQYLAAMTFKFAATGSAAARAEALETFKALVWLGDITAKPGFFARAVWSVKSDQGARATQGSGGLPAKWNPTPDGLWLWKGDTSSDEVNSHYYAISLFHDLAAKGPERQRAAKHLADITSHIMDNGWVLRDVDGQPTRWGRWDPEYLLQPYGYESRGLNGMEAQTYAQTALALTGDPKYQAGLEQLLKWGYQNYTVRQKLTFPPDSIVTWDDELAFHCYHPLIRYARDPDLRSLYLRSLERHWEVMRMQQVPFFNFIYGSLTGNDCEAPQAVQHLREWSLDLVNYTYHNSHRSDLAPRPGYVPYMGGTRAISPREIGPDFGSRSAIQYDGGDNGHAMTPPIGWLEDYWMGRYYGFIAAPKTTDPKLINVSPRATKSSGALPYDGPARPILAWEK